MKAIIVDDEPDCVKLLALQLKLYCPKVEVIGECTDSNEAIRLIKEKKPSIVFLDIEMPIKNGFQVLEEIENLNFAIVFVTAYDKFAVKAFRYSAVDYLLKPIDAKELVDAVQKIEKTSFTENKQLHILKENYTQKILPEKIALPFQNGVTFVKVNDIIYCESADNYTKFILNDKQSYLVAKTLKDVCEILEDYHFIRVHRQFIVNGNAILKFVKGGNNYLIMNNKETIPVSRSQKENLMERFGWI